MRTRPPAAKVIPMAVETLEQAFADEREELGVLRRKGFAADADRIERVIDRLAKAASPFIDWLSENDARLRSNRSIDWLRAQFPALQSQGLARWNPARPNQRQFLRCAIPQRANTSAAREAGARGERLAG